MAAVERDRLDFGDVALRQAFIDAPPSSEICFDIRLIRETDLDDHPLVIRQPRISERFEDAVLIDGFKGLRHAFSILPVHNSNSPSTSLSMTKSGPLQPRHPHHLFERRLPFGQ